ncbi:MAG: hypothetical protein AAGF47_07115 [Planctomycetota bacterium]
MKLTDRTVSRRTSHSLVAAGLLLAAPGLGGCNIPKMNPISLPEFSMGGNTPQMLDLFLGLSASQSIGMTDSNRTLVLANVLGGAAGQQLAALLTREMQAAERAQAQAKAKQAAENTDPELLDAARESETDLLVPYGEEVREDGTVIILYARADADGNLISDETIEVTEEEVEQTIAAQQESKQVTELEDNSRVLMLAPTDDDDEVS